MARITHFHISGENPKKLVPFYEKIFHWKFDKTEGPMEYWAITTGSDDQVGINGGLHRRQWDNRVVNTIEVDNIDAVIHQIKENGGTLVVEKTAIYGVGWVAHFEDPEKNLLALMQADTSAG